MERQEGRLGPQATNQDTVLGHEDQPRMKKESKLQEEPGQGHGLGEALPI